MNTYNLTKHGYGALHEDERAREYLIRAYVCPTCGAEVDKPCLIDGKKNFASHVARYDRAAADGIVPQLPAWRSGHGTDRVPDHRVVTPA